MKLHIWARAVLLTCAVFAAGSASAAAVKIGFVTTLTTPAAVIGQQMERALALAMSHMGGKMAGLDVELIVEDDGFKPGVGKHKSDKLIKQHGVDFVAGYIWSHVLLASSRSVFRADAFLISANAGPSRIAGKRCHPNFFSTSWQNDQMPMAMGEYLNRVGVKSLYVMAPNYAAGKDMVAGLTHTFSGAIKGKDMTKWGSGAQLDFSAELAKARASGAEGIFVFYPGKAGSAFIKQYQQAGLQGVLPLYSVFTVDAISLPKLQAAELSGILGSKDTQTWSPDLDNPANRRFVADYLNRYGAYPSFYAAQAYDAMRLIESAVQAVGGDMSDKDGLRRALRRADYDSVKGKYTVGANGMPIQNFYLREVVQDAEGRWTTRIVSTVYDAHQDRYAKDCPLP